MVEMACLFAVDAGFLIMDEPTAGVSHQETARLRPLIKRIQTELDATVLLVEHDMEVVMALSDRMYCMEAGRVIAEGTPAEIRTDPQVIASYLGTDDGAETVAEELARDAHVRKAELATALEGTIER